MDRLPAEMVKIIAAHAGFFDRQDHCMQQTALSSVRDREERRPRRGADGRRRDVRGRRRVMAALRRRALRVLRGRSCAECARHDVAD